MEKFTGFVYDSPPIYEVITPQTLYKFGVSGLTVETEERFRTSSVIESPANFGRIMDEVIWSCIIEKEDSFKTIDDYKKKLTSIDRDALLFGILVKSNDDLTDISIKCPKCSKKFEGAVNLSETPVITMFSGKRGECLKKEYSFKVGKTHKIFYSVPTIEREHEVSLFLDGRKVSDTLRILVEAIKKIVDEETKEEVTGLFDIEIAANSLRSTDKKKILKDIQAGLNGAGIEFKYNVFCVNPQCGSKIEGNISVLDMFFRTIY